MTYRFTYSTSRAFLSFDKPQETHTIELLVHMKIVEEIHEVHDINYNSVSVISLIKIFCPEVLLTLRKAGRKYLSLSNPNYATPISNRQ